MTDFNIFAWMRAIQGSNLPAGVRHVLCTLATFASVGDGVCWPSLVTLAVACGYHRATIINHMAKADAAGWVRRESRPGTSTKYQLLYPQIAQAPVAARQINPSQYTTPPVVNHDVVNHDPAQIGSAQYTTLPVAICDQHPSQYTTLPVVNSVHEQLRNRSEEQLKNRKEEDAREITPPLPPKLTPAPQPPPPVPVPSVSPPASVSTPTPESVVPSASVAEDALEDLPVRHRPNVADRQPVHAVEMGEVDQAWREVLGHRLTGSWTRWLTAVLPYLSEDERAELLEVASVDVAKGKHPSPPFLATVVSRIVRDSSPQASPERTDGRRAQGRTWREEPRKPCSPHGGMEAVEFYQDCAEWQPRRVGKIEGKITGRVS